jgi:methanogenic corrinoid protein MtbC1
MQSLPPRRRVALSAGVVPTNPGTEGTAVSNLVPAPLYERYLAALLEGEREQCRAVVEELRAALLPLRSLYVDLFQRSLYRVGELWEHNRISVATEHLATAITERLVAQVQPQVCGGPKGDRTIVVACVADEYHQLGGRMAADLFELHGWRGYFLGANTPHESLLTMIDRKRPALVGLSLSISFNLPSLLAALDAVRGAWPELPVLVGGQAFRWGGAERLNRYERVSLVGSIDELETIAARHD